MNDTTITTNALIDEARAAIIAATGCPEEFSSYDQTVWDCLDKLAEALRTLEAKVDFTASALGREKDICESLTAENEALTKELKMVNRLLEEALNSKHAYQQQLKTALSNVERAESLMRTASDDATRLGTENQKLSLDLKCLEESTVDFKAYAALTKQLDKLYVEMNQMQAGLEEGNGLLHAEVAALTAERDENKRLYMTSLRNVQTSVAHAADLNAQLERANNETNSLRLDRDFWKESSNDWEEQCAEARHE